MPRETMQAKSARARLILAGLKQAYPDAHCELDYSNPLELLVATILSARCTDKQVNLVTPRLFKKYPNAAAYASASLADLEDDIHSLGFFRNKAKSIQNCSRQLVEKHSGQVPRSMDELVQLAGVGRKTANVVLGNAFDINEGIVVDTHVSRLSQRMGFSQETDPEKIEEDLQKLAPKESWTMLSHWLIWHGRHRCNARKPDCPHCEVLDYCPAGAGNKVNPAR